MGIVSVKDGFRATSILVTVDSNSLFEIRYRQFRDDPDFGEKNGILGIFPDLGERSSGTLIDHPASFLGCLEGF